MDTLKIQQRLNQIFQNKLKEDGISGPNTINQIKIFQKMEGLNNDGIVGPNTLKKLFPINKTKMQVSKLSISKIDYWETGGREYYEKFLQKFTWPGGSSGITVGFGYDLGYYTSQDIINTWTGYVNGNIIALMTSVSGLKGEQAKKMINEQMRRAIIPYDVAGEVFLKTTLPDEARKTERVYPGVTELLPDAQGALLSLIYNRGAQLEDEKSDRRREMKAIAPLVLSKDYKGIAAQIISMKRLWIGKGMDGLIERRDGEAELVLNAVHDYTPDEIISI
jgi:hypothetical protein